MKTEGALRLSEPQRQAGCLAMLNRRVVGFWLGIRIFGTGMQGNESSLLLSGTEKNEKKN